MSKIEELRKKLIEDYCQSILWIDDDIDHSKNSSKSALHTEFFQRLAEGFSDQGLLCHLQNFPQRGAEESSFSSGDNTEEIDKCINLSKKAEIVIIDWFLGKSNSASNAIDIIRKIGDIGGTKFVVILSAQEKSFDEITTELGYGFEKVAKTEWLKTSSDLFVTLKQKKDFEENGGSNLLDEIFGQLQAIYPDYLHWTSIEMATKIKTGIPKLLSALPKRTDLGLLAQIDDLDKELGEAIGSQNLAELLIQNFFEDLQGACYPQSVTSLSRDHIAFAEWDELYEWKDSFDQDLSDLKDSGEEKLANHIELLRPGSGRALAKAPIKTVYENRTKLVAYKALVRLVDSHEAFGEYTEFISPGDGTNRVSPGSILVREAGENPDEILMCISQACDCARKENLLYLRAERQNVRGQSRPNESSLRFKGYDYKISGDVSDLVVIEGHIGGAPPDGTSLKGRIRGSNAARIADRFWDKTTRLGVNISEYLRKCRNEID